MAKFSSFLKHLFSFQNYPRYFVDIYVNFILQRLWRQQGIILGKNIYWYGKPIISQFEDSSIIIGAGCRICSDSTQTALGVNHPVILSTLKPGANLQIGAGVRMSGTTICAANSVIIGDRCVIGANVTIVDTDFHSLDPAVRISNDDFMSAISKPVIIGEDVFIGGNSIVLKGVSIGNKSVIGAGSVVTKSVPERVIAAGNPARAITHLHAAQPTLQNESLQNHK